MSTVEVLYTEEEFAKLKSFELNKNRVVTLLDTLEAIKECDMPTLALEAQIIAKLEQIIDEI